MSASLTSCVHVHESHLWTEKTAFQYVKSVVKEFDRNMVYIITLVGESHLWTEEATFQYVKSVVKEIVRNVVYIITQTVVLHWGDML